MPVRAVLVFALPALVVGLAACGSRTNSSSSADAGTPLVETGTLTVCSDVPYPPFEDFDEAPPAGVIGFDIVSYVADDLGLELVVKDSDFDALQSGLARDAGQCDPVATALTITSARKEKLPFTTGYYDSQQALLVPAGSPVAGMEELAGLKVGVQKGTTGESYAQENAPDADLVSFPSDAQMYAAIRAGQVDALLQDLPVNLEHERASEPADFEIVGTYDTDEEYGFAIRKTNTGLISDVDASLQRMRDSGDYHEAFDTYFTSS